MITLRYAVDGEVQPDPVRILWSVPTDIGYQVSLISHPEHNYVIAQTDAPFIEGQNFTDDALPWGQGCIALGRPDAGALAVALITALIENSEQLIGYYIDEFMGTRDSARLVAREAIDAAVAEGRLVRTPGGGVKEP